MAVVKVINRAEAYAAAVLITISYMIFYMFFTGAAQYIQTARLGIPETRLILTEVQTQLYSGPLIQVVGDGFILNIRVYPLLIGLAVSSIVGLNGTLLWLIYRRRLMRACLLGGAWGGVGGVIASIASFGYVCCGWPASLALFGLSIVASLSPYLTTAAIILLAANGYTLHRRLNIIHKIKTTNI
ncbi:MAG: hypothetical protein QXV97_04785 [Candidatus Caldarchaeum sp.]